MQKIRKIDFKRLWKCINSNVNNHAWRNPEYHPVPVTFYDEESGDLEDGWIKLPIQLNPPKRGGVCRFVVVIRIPKPVSLAKYLQTNHFKNHPPKIYSSLLNCLVACYCDGMQVPEDMIPKDDRDMLKRQAIRYGNASKEFGE